MKLLLFSSCAVKFNVLITLCALGTNALSLPVMAAPQEVCVKTLNGSIVCGTLVPKSSSNPNRADTDTTIQTEVDGNVTWDLKSCGRKLKTVYCTFSISTSKDGNYGIRVAPTKMADVEGNEYAANLVQSGTRQSAAGGNDGIHIDMAVNAHYKIVIGFPGVPASVSQVNLLKICVNDCFGSVKFRDIPINQ